MSQKTQRIYKTIMLVLLTAAITFIITSVAMYNFSGKEKVKYITATDTIGKTFQTFRSFIEKNYFGEIDDSKMLESAIKGYVAGLNDEYSEYITKEEMEEYMEDTTGKYVGIGIYIANNTKTNQIVVLMPMKESPAEEAGIKSGDIITKIDGVAYTGEELNKASSALKSKEGTKAKIEILRDGETINLEVERRKIKVNHIETEVLESQIGYMEISTFDEGCYDEFKQKWEELKAKNITSLIIDLRNNGGGIVDEATNIADLMVEKDRTLLITASKNKEEHITKAKEEKNINIPIVVLVNENTASASEILTAAVRENNENVKIIGTTTYGKGVIQTIYKLTDGSGIKLTTNAYYTPNHNEINKVGIKPDIEVELPEEESFYSVKMENDTQLQKAIEILK